MIDDPQIQVPQPGNRSGSRWRKIMSGHAEDGHRHGYRFRTGVLAEIEDGGLPIACEAQNISRSGVLLVGEFPVPSSETMDVRIHAPTGNLSVRLKGRVIRVQHDVDEGGLRIALEFVEMDDSRRDALEVLLSRILEAPPAGTFDDLKPGATPQEIRAALEAIPLTQRISLASRAGPKEREFLRSDIHPAVLEALARNPSLTAAEARVLATSVYASSSTLDVLANEPRLKGDDELRMAIAVHPRVTLGTAEKVTAEFKVPQLKKLLAKPNLNQLLREKLLRKTR
jgi:hypothetical protein